MIVTTPSARDRPQEAALFQALREQTGTLAIVPNDLDQIAAPAAEDKEMTAMGIVLQRLLHHQRKAGEALPHIGVAFTSKINHLTCSYQSA